MTALPSATSSLLSITLTAFYIGLLGWGIWPNPYLHCQQRIAGQWIGLSTRVRQLQKHTKPTGRARITDSREDLRDSTGDRFRAAGDLRRTSSPVPIQSSNPKVEG